MSDWRRKHTEPLPDIPYESWDNDWIDAVNECSQLGTWTTRDALGYCDFMSEPKNQINLVKFNTFIDAADKAYDEYVESHKCIG